MKNILLFALTIGAAVSYAQNGSLPPVTFPANLFHIHGNTDLIFPIIFVKPDVVIKGGGHLMIHKKAAEISVILAEQLNKLIGK